MKSTGCHKNFFLIQACLAALAIIVFSSTFADAPFNVREASPLPNQLGTYRYIQYADTSLHALTLDDNYRAEIYQQDAQVQSLAKSLRDISRKQDVVIAINGGFYTPKFQPAGLFIYQDKTFRHLAKDSLLTACLGMNKDKKLFLATRRENCLNAFSAMQVGPVLIQNAQLSKYLNNSRPSTQEFFTAHRRTIIAQSADGRLLVLVTSPTTLLAVAQLLKEHPAVFGMNKIITAINLDGGTSTGMYIQFKNHSFYLPEQKKVKTFVFFR